MTPMGRDNSNVVAGLEPGSRSRPERPNSCYALRAYLGSPHHIIRTKAAQQISRLSKA